jgi:hypothetical protein
MILPARVCVNRYWRLLVSVLTLIFIILGFSSKEIYQQIASLYSELRALDSVLIYSSCFTLGILDGVGIFRFKSIQNQREVLEMNQSKKNRKEYRGRSLVYLDPMGRFTQRV